VHSILLKAFFGYDKMAVGEWKEWNGEEDIRQQLSYWLNVKLFIISWLFNF
jgi:hypothetical protein